MTLSLTCKSCGKKLAAETEAELVELGHDHAREHGHDQESRHPLSRERVLNRIRRNNRSAR